MKYVIEMIGVTKMFRRGWRQAQFTALQDISFQVPEGEAFGFIGANGAGKSTTIKILTGALLASSGRASLMGFSVEEPDSRRGVGYVPENPSLYDYLTPLEVLLLGVRLHRTSVPHPVNHCRTWLERLGLAEVADKPIRSFSKGMAQRVAIAHALAINPRLLILDEPLSGLDPVGRRDVVDMLSEYKQGGGTLFFTSHVLHDVERLADRFGLIHQGMLKAVQSPAELLGGEEMVTVRSLGKEPVGSMVEEMGGRWRGQVPRDEVWAVLRALEAAKHTLIEVRPVLSLETAFLRAIGRE